jgi:hypothetical protein
MYEYTKIQFKFITFIYYGVIKHESVGNNENLNYFGITTTVI